MISKERLLDLALSYALDNPAIHQNDPDNVTALREMQTQVLAGLRDGTELTLDLEMRAWRRGEVL